MINKELYSEEMLYLLKKVQPKFEPSLIGPNDEFVTYKKENQIIGLVQFFQLYETLEIINIIVLEEFQKQGIGTKLIDYLENEYKPAKIILEVRESNTNAIKFYGRLDFKNVRTIKNYYDKEDAYALLKVI